MSASFAASPPFPDAARDAVRDAQLRANLAHATTTIRRKRDAAIGELPDLEQLRTSAEAVKSDALGRLGALLEDLERAVGAAGGTVHFAADATEANRIVCDLVAATGEREVVKVKSMTTAEIGLNDALASAGITAYETDLAELIVQLGGDLPSHIVVPAIHRNRAEIREIFVREMGRRGRPAPAELSDEPAALAGAARAHLRERFLGTKVAISGANFAIADSGALVVVESEGNGRMCLTLPETLISVVGIDKVLPTYTDLEIFLQLLARSATGERMSPYTSIWTGPTAGDGPRDVHLVLLDNGRSDALADPVGRQALRCIRCAACLNVCPVYERVGGHAYGSVYPGPIGAVLAPQLDRVVTDPVAASLPFASTLCGACFAVCPVRIDIPRLLVHLRGEIVERAAARGPTAESVAMAAAGYTLGSSRRLALAERAGATVARVLFPRGRVGRLPGPLGRWTDARDAPVPAAQSFRAWWLAEHGGVTGEVEPEGGLGRARASRELGIVSVLRSLAPRSRAARGVARVRASRAPLGEAPSAEPGSARRGARGGRDAVLAAVRRAIATAPGPSGPVPREYRRATQPGLAASDTTARRDRFAERVTDYRATLHHASPDDVATAVAEALAAGGASRVVLPADFPEELLPGVELGCAASFTRDSPPVPIVELERSDAAVTACAVAVAETGTIVLDGGAAQGRRLLSLLPDQLVVVVRASQIVDNIPDALAALVATAPQTWISGPSATSDIELDRVEGVHGPRRLDVVLVDDSTRP
ncbi:MAG TPA: LUD domain-containing protein [Acidimicrobiales bacterium]|nr:LUD domain-containing protein [Acidimicrobiales bacterium]